MRQSSVLFKGDVQGLIDSVFHDGFVLIKNFFDVDHVLRARGELLSLLERDLKARDEAEYRRPVRMDEGLYKTSLTPLMHTRLFPSWESEAFSSILDDMFSSEVIKAFMSSVVGDNYRLRVDLVRRSTGVDDTVDDFQIPHEWHRDEPGEFTFGIFFDDLERHASGGTAVIPGTHYEKFDPRWDLLLSRKGRAYREDYLSGEMRSVPDELYELAIWNKKAREEVESSTVEIVGELGDVYFFLNDTWHGRFPNRTGRKLLISRIGGFPTDFAFKDDIPLPNDGFKLPPVLRGLYGSDHPVNECKDTLVRKILSRNTLSNLRELAAKEKAELVKGLRDAELG